MDNTQLTDLVTTTLKSLDIPITSDKVSEILKHPLFCISEPQKSIDKVILEIFLEDLSLDDISLLKEIFYAIEQPVTMSKVILETEGMTRVRQILVLMHRQTGEIRESDLLFMLNPKEKNWFEVIQMESLASSIDFRYTIGNSLRQTVDRGGMVYQQSSWSEHMGKEDFNRSQNEQEIAQVFDLIGRQVKEHVRDKGALKEIGEQMGVMNSLIGRLSLEVGEEKTRREAEESELREQEKRVRDQKQALDQLERENEKLEEESAQLTSQVEAMQRESKAEGRSQVVMLEMKHQMLLLSKDKDEQDILIRKLQDERDQQTLYQENHQNQNQTQAQQIAVQQQQVEWAYKNNLQEAQGKYRATAQELLDLIEQYKGQVRMVEELKNIVEQLRVAIKETQQEAQQANARNRQLQEEVDQMSRQNSVPLGQFLEEGADSSEPDDSLIKYSYFVKPRDTQQPSLGETQVLRDTGNHSQLSANIQHFGKDYLELLRKPHVQEILKKYKDTESTQIFSDLIYKITSRQKRQMRHLLITSTFLYEIGHKTMQLKRMIPLGLIYKISISEKSGLLMQLHVKGQLDYLMNCFKRSNLTLFLSQVIQQQCQLKPEIQLTQDLVTKLRGNSLLSKLNPRDVLNIQEGYTNARYYGFLFMRTDFLKGLFKQHQFKKYFFVLSDIGLVCLREPSSKEPKCIIPVIGSQLLVSPAGMKKDNGFLLLAADGSEDQFYCESKTQLEECIEGIRVVQNIGIDTIKQKNHSLVQ